jgi:hypothetical protein
LYLTKIWIFAICVAAAGVFGVTLLVSRSAKSGIEHEERTRVGNLQQAAQLLLKLDARVKMDHAALLAGDSVLAGALEEVQKGSTDRALHQTVLERLRVFNQQLKLNFLCALDGRGKVLARVTLSGEGDATNFGDSMAGFPVIADALRGYRGEDAWAQDGQVFRVAASPVLSRTHDRYVGALVVGIVAGDDLVKRMREILDADVAFYLHGKLIASSVSSPALNEAPAEVNRRADEIAKLGRTTAFPLIGGSARYWAIGTPIMGEAAQQDAYFVLLLPRSEATSGLVGLLRTANNDDATGSGSPWALLVALFGLLVALGLLWIEAEGPLGRLREQAARLAAGDLVRFNEQRLKGRFAAIARSVNAAFERVSRHGSGAVDVPASLPGRLPTVDPAPFGGVAAGGIAGLHSPLPAALPMSPGMPATAAQGLTPGSKALPRPPIGRSAQPPELVPQPGSPAYMGRLIDLEEDPGALPEEPPTQNARNNNLHELMETLPQLDAMPLEDRRAPAPQAKRGAIPSASKPQPPGTVPLVTNPAALPVVSNHGLAGQGGRLAASQGPGLAPPSLPPVRARRPTPLGEPLVPESAPYPPELLPPPELSEKTLIKLPDEMLSETGVDDGEVDNDEGYFREVFDQFLALKRKCGEPTESLTLAKFVVKLRDNRDQLRKKLGVRSVRFQVYVKDGKAALKATPVRD